MIRQTSSYEQNDFRTYFEIITGLIRPKSIAEFGIGNGYSTQSFVNTSNCPIHANDLFDDFPFNRADYPTIVNLFKNNPFVKVEKRDFYKSLNVYSDKSIDILHIDIANDGSVYKFAVDNYMRKLTDSGVMLLEGGSKERDEVDWMNKYGKPKINPYLQTITAYFDVKIINKFPSLTIIRNK